MKHSSARFMTILMALAGAGASYGVKAGDWLPWMWDPSRPDSPSGALVVSDLTPDPAFADHGHAIIDFNEGGDDEDVALRVFPTGDGGSWVVGVHQGPGVGRQMAIVRLDPNGAPDPTYNGTGSRLVSSTFESVTDVARGPGDVFYFVGTHVASGATDLDLEIDCVDPAGLPCPAFGNAGKVYGVFDLGGPEHRDDRPTRVVYFNGALLLVGETDTGSTERNYAMFAYKLSATTGARDAAFGNSAVTGLTVFNPDAVPNASDIATDLVVYAPTPTTSRLIFTGFSLTGGSDSIGWIVSLDGGTGLQDSLINQVVYMDTASGRSGVLTRIIRRRDGGFVAAGLAQETMDDHLVDEPLLMVAFNADGTRDLRFGLPGGSGALHTMVGSFSNLPFGIAERADSRDLVVGLTAVDDTPGAKAYQVVVQLGSSGNVMHAYAYADPPDASRYGEGRDLVLDGRHVLTAGDREWSASPRDYDMVVARFDALDTIFADRFGGPASD